ncbi:MAG: winged helix DNA-binding protein [Actinobacteria bacterium]|nr:MAG: winged helix DNA-binding protein [Actinomycetota bacterium]
MLDESAAAVQDRAVAEPDLSHQLLGAFRSIDQEVQRALRDRGILDIRPSQGTTLLLVDRAGTRLTELAQRAGMTKQAMMEIVDELQELGCVRRVPDPGDARAKIVRLTAKGLRHRAGTRKAVQTVEARMRRWLGDRRYDVLRAMLAEIIVAEE